MKPVLFPGVNIVYGRGQKEYQELPALKMPDGEVITCWELTEEELDKIILTGRIYFQQLTFNNPLQPILPLVELGDDLNLLR